MIHIGIYPLNENMRNFNNPKDDLEYSKKKKLSIYLSRDATSNSNEQLTRCRVSRRPDL